MESIKMNKLGLAVILVMLLSGCGEDATSSDSATASQEMKKAEKQDVAASDAMEAKLADEKSMAQAKLDEAKAAAQSEMDEAKAAAEAKLAEEKASAEAKLAEEKQRILDQANEKKEELKKSLADKLGQ